MSRADPKMRHFAKRIIVYEASEIPSAKTSTPAGFPVPEKLRPHLAGLMGDGGFRALLARALALAGEEVPELRAVQVQADGSLAGAVELQAQLGAGRFLEGRIVLLAQLLGLLAAFIGENLTLNLVRGIWPKLPLDDLDFGDGGKHEYEYGGKHEKTK